MSGGDGTSSDTGAGGGGGGATVARSEDAPGANPTPGVRGDGGAWC